MAKYDDERDPLERGDCGEEGFGEGFNPFDPDTNRDPNRESLVWDGDEGDDEEAQAAYRRFLRRKKRRRAA
jgi:hypothetical protein